MSGLMTRVPGHARTQLASGVGEGVLLGYEAPVRSAILSLVF